MVSPGSALRVPDVQSGSRGTSICINWKPIRNATSQTLPSGASESQSGFPTTLGEPQVIPQVIKSRGVTEVGVLIIPVYTDKKAPLAAMLLYLTYACVCARLLQSCPTLCHPVDCSPLGSSVQEVLQA